MADINGVRTGISSTTTMEDASELAQVVTKHERSDLEWHADHPSMMAEYAASKDVPTPLEFVKNHGIATAATAGLSAGAMTKSFFSNAPALFNGDATFKETFVDKGLAWGARFATSGALLTTAFVAGAAANVAVYLKAATDGVSIKQMGQLDAIDVSTVALLDVDPGYRTAEYAKHPNITPTKLEAFMRESTFGKTHMPALQAEADEGMREALVALKCGGRAEYFRVHPDSEKRLANDVAFNKGFESVFWCRAQQDGDARLAAIGKGLDARDPRATQVPQILHG